MAPGGPVRDLDDLIDRVYQQPSLPLGLRRDLQAALLELEDLREHVGRKHLAFRAEAAAVARALQRCEGDARRAREQFRHLDKWKWARLVARATQLLRRKLTRSNPPGASPSWPRRT
jgi:hypothetical protein